MQELIICFLIFIGKILDIISYTVRTTLANRGEKMWVTFFGIINNFVGVIVLAVVVLGITESPFRVIAFGLGEAIGTYLGMLLDRKLAIGKNMITIIVDKKESEKLVNLLENKGFNVVTLIGKGLKEERAILKISIDRKKEYNVKRILEDQEINSVIFESPIINNENIKNIKGAYK